MAASSQLQDGTPRDQLAADHPQNDEQIEVFDAQDHTDLTDKPPVSWTRSLKGEQTASTHQTRAPEIAQHEQMQSGNTFDVPSPPASVLGDDVSQAQHSFAPHAASTKLLDTDEQPESPFPISADSVFQSDLPADGSTSCIKIDLPHNPGNSPIDGQRPQTPLPPSLRSQKVVARDSSSRTPKAMPWCNARDTISVAGRPSSISTSRPRKQTTKSIAQPAGDPSLFPLLTASSSGSSLAMPRTPRRNRKDLSHRLSPVLFNDTD